MKQPSEKTLRKFGDTFAKKDGETVTIDYILGDKTLSVKAKAYLTAEDMINIAREFTLITFNEDGMYMGEFFDFAKAVVALKHIFEIEPLKENDNDEKIDINATYQLYTALMCGETTPETEKNKYVVEDLNSDIGCYLEHVVDYVDWRAQHETQLMLYDSVSSIEVSMGSLKELTELIKNASTLVSTLLNKINEIDNGALLNYAGQIAKATNNIDEDGLLGALVNAYAEGKIPKEESEED